MSDHKAPSLFSGEDPMVRSPAQRTKLAVNSRTAQCPNKSKSRGCKATAAGTVKPQPAGTSVQKGGEAAPIPWTALLSRLNEDTG